MHLQHLCRSCRKLVVCVVFSPLFSCFHGAVLDALLADTLRNWGSFVVNAVMACQAIANIVKSSLGPVGLDKVRIIMFFFITEFCSLSFCFLVAPCNKSLYKLDCRGFFAVKEILRLRETPFILATTISTWKQLSFAGHNAWKPIRFSCQRRICLSL
jgi:hypothetical protein